MNQGESFRLEMIGPVKSICPEDVTKTKIQKSRCKPKTVKNKSLEDNTSFEEKP